MAKIIHFETVIQNGYQIFKVLDDDGRIFVRKEGCNWEKLKVYPPGDDPNFLLEAQKADFRRRIEDGEITI